MLPVLLSLLISVSLPDEPPALAGGLEEVAQRYYAAPESVAAAPVVTEEGLSGATHFALASALSRIEAALGDCQVQREQMTALIAQDLGSYAVHPDWLKAYQNCLVQRQDEVALLPPAISAAQTAMMAGQDAETGVRVADMTANLILYRTRLRDAVVEEFEAQKELVAFYRQGGGRPGGEAIGEMSAEEAKEVFGDRDEGDPEQ